MEARAQDCSINRAFIVTDGEQFFGLSYLTLVEMSLL